jgi:cytidylate kinase
LTETGAVDGKYLQCLRQVVLSLGHHGDAVIVGRGAQYLLPPQCALRVRLVAPLEFRARTLAEHAGLSFKDARAKIKTTDITRTTFIWKTFHSSADSPLNYDLVINTAETGIAGATDIVIAAIATKLGVRGASASQSN